MSYAAIRAAVVSRLQGVTGIGQVAAYERFHLAAMEDPSWQARFVRDGRINYWFVDRTGKTTSYIPASDSAVSRRHDIVITGVYGFDGGLNRPGGAIGDGATALQFQDLLDDIERAFTEGDCSLGGACYTYENPRVQQIRLTAFQEATIMVHAAQISITVEERG